METKNKTQTQTQTQVKDIEMMENYKITICSHKESIQEIFDVIGKATNRDEIFHGIDIFDICTDEEDVLENRIRKILNLISYQRLWKIGNSYESDIKQYDNLFESLPKKLKNYCEKQEFEKAIIICIKKLIKNGN